MLDNQRRVTSNFLLHDDEDSQFNRQQIYVPLALVERRKPDKKESEHFPEAGSKLYEPQYEEKQRFEHQAFLQQILEKGESKTKGKRIALIGEPGAGKTTTLQDIAFWVLEKDLGLPIWISLADLGHNGNLIDYIFNDWLNLAVSFSERNSAKQELETQIQQGRVWFLLDGVDEVATSGSQILQHLYKQLTGWLGNSRVILTCRLNIWQADLNFLSDFETYRLLDLDYPQQVHQFIHNWFGSKDVSKGERLKTELENPDKTRLRDLIQNPLRLTLLCSSWQSNKGNLPDTKAELYAQFVRQFYKWKSNCFPVNTRQQQELNKALGQLAIKDIDGSSSRFRLQESFISKDTRLLAAESLGKIDSGNEIAISALVHAINSLTDGWTLYRAADSLGKTDPGNEIAISALVNVINSSTEEWIRRLAVESLERIDPGNQIAISALVKLINSSNDESILYRAADSLGKIDPGNQTAILALVNVINSSNDELILYQAADSLGKIDPGNQTAILALVNVINSSNDELILYQAADSLGKIDPENQTAILALVNVINSSNDESILYQAADSLGKIDPGNEIAVARLIQLINLNLIIDNYTFEQGIESLEEILTKPLMPEVVKKLKHSRLSCICDTLRSFIHLCRELGYHTPSKFSRQDILDYCAQNLSYPEFYSAWHS